MYEIKRTTAKRSRQTPDGPATFKIFWARMDYLLGKSDKWMTGLDLLIEKKAPRRWT